MFVFSPDFGHECSTTRTQNYSRFNDALLLLQFPSTVMTHLIHKFQFHSIMRRYLKLPPFSPHQLPTKTRESTSDIRKADGRAKGTNRQTELLDGSDGARTDDLTQEQTRLRRNERAHTRARREKRTADPWKEEGRWRV